MGNLDTTLPGRSLAGIMDAMDASNSLYVTPFLHIPLAELEFRFSRSSGPGGQHVNRSETRVELLFDVARSASLSELQRERLLEKLGHLIDQHGVLHLTASESRSQHQNREIVLTRLQKLLQAALRPKKHRRPTRPSRAARERRLENKRRRSQKKQTRRPADW